MFVKKSEIESTFVDDRKLINLQKLSAREKEKSLIPANIKYKTAWKAINNIKKSRCGVERQRNP